MFARANDAEPTLGGGFERVPARSNSDSTSTSTSRSKPSGGWFSGRGGDYSARREGVSFRGSDGAGDEGEIAALQRVIEDMTEERLALQRGLDRQQELMQTLAEENESLTSRLNEQASETSEWREELERLREEARARDALTSALTEQRDVARAAAIESRERATRSSVEAIELEERMLEMRSESLRMRREMDAERADRERQDRALRAAAADRNEMQTALAAMRSERESLQSKLRRMAVREELEMAEGAKGDDGDDGDAGRSVDSRARTGSGSGNGAGTGAGGRSPGGPENTPASTAAPTPHDTPAKLDARARENIRASRLATDLGDALADAGVDRGGAPGEDDDAPRGFFHFMSRSMNGVPLGGVPVDKVGEDQLRLVDSIHALLTEVESERARAREALEASKAKIAGLGASNETLRRRLEEATTRLTRAGVAPPSPPSPSPGPAAADALVSEADRRLAEEPEEWSEDEVDESRARRGFFSYLNPFGGRRRVQE